MDTATTSPTLTTVARPAVPSRSLAVVAGLMALFVVLEAIGARVRIPVPGSPIPLTLQTLVVFLSAAFLGSRAGAATQITYVGLGAIGLPMFTGGAGFLYLFGPTGGYLFGFVMAAWLIGRLIETGAGESYAKTFVAILLGSFVVIGMGSLYLSLFYGGDFLAGMLHGGLAFAFADVAKVAAAAGIYHALRRR